MAGVRGRTHNPIFQREMIRESRQPAVRRWQKYAGVVVLLGTPVLLGGLLHWMYPSPYDEPLVWMFFPSWAIWVVHALVAVQAAIASAHVITHEYRNQTWDLLILTGISAERILIGKWFAALQRIRGWLLVLGISRMSLLPLYWFIAVKLAATECAPAMQACIVHEALPLRAWTLALGMLVGLTILDVLCCSAIGLASGTLIHDARAATFAAILVRFSPLFAFLASGFDSYHFWSWWSLPSFSLVDGGIGATVQMVLPLTPRQVELDPMRGIALITVALTGGLCIVLMLVMVGLKRRGATVGRTKK